MEQITKKFFALAARDELLVRHPVRAVGLIAQLLRFHCS